MKMSCKIFELTPWEKSGSLKLMQQSLPKSRNRDHHDTNLFNEEFKLYFY